MPSPRSSRARFLTATIAGMLLLRRGGADALVRPRAKRVWERAAARRRGWADEGVRPSLSERGKRLREIGRTWRCEGHDLTRSRMRKRDPFRAGALSDGDDRGHVALTPRRTSGRPRPLATEASLGAS